MTGFYCPVEGCEKRHDAWNDDSPPFASKGAVRSHINAMTDEAHNRAGEQDAWKEAPEAGNVDGDQAESSDDQANEQGSSSNEQAEVPDSDGVESSGEQATEEANSSEEQAIEGEESSNEQAIEQANSSDEQETMVDQAEYEAQQSRQTKGGKGGESSNEQATEQANRGLPTPSLPNVSPMWTVVIIAAVFAAIVLWRVHRARSTSSPTPTVDAQNDEPEGDEVPLFE